MMKVAAQGGPNYGRSARGPWNTRPVPFNEDLAPAHYVPAPERYGPMPYRRCGRSGLKLPAISLGLWQNFGDDFPLQNSRALDFDDAELQEIDRHAVDGGINLWAASSRA